MIRELNRYTLGDMCAIYYIDEEKQVPELCIVPADMAGEVADRNAGVKKIEPLFELKLVGDDYPDQSSGFTMRRSGTCYRMKYDYQQVMEEEGYTVIATSCRDEYGVTLTHMLTHHRDAPYLLSKVVIENDSENKISLEKFDSFSLGNITPFSEGDGGADIVLYQIRSFWSREGKLVSNTLQELQLEQSWANEFPRCLRYGSLGSEPVKSYFPYGVIEDRASGVFWGAMLAHNASWQMEVCRVDETTAFGGGLADREFGHWIKDIGPMEQFVTPTAILTCAKGDIDSISQRMTAQMIPSCEAGPVFEQHLPVLFNEYCTTWGEPSHDNIMKILEALRGRGVEIFVIDCGWYKTEGVPWGDSMGDYNISQALFPEGLDKTVAAIHREKMHAGIWFEIDNVGKKSDYYNKTDLLLTRDGYTLTTPSRRFRDMRKEENIAFLEEKVIKLLKACDFDYIKMDYNESIGIGCDGAESLGEGLRANMAASFSFIKEVKERVPGIILENCSSGGHKLEPKMMNLCAMASFSDAHEAVEIPIIAASLHRTILPRQSQIWAVIRKTDSLRRIAYSVSCGLLGRLCLSGDVTELDDEQWQVIDNGISFYKKVVPVIKNGLSHICQNITASWRHPTGYQAVVREGIKDAEGSCLVTVHTFEGGYPEKIEIKLPSEGYKVREHYSDTEPDIKVNGDVFVYRPAADFKGLGVLLAK